MWRGGKGGVNKDHLRRREFWKGEGKKNEDSPPPLLHGIKLPHFKKAGVGE